MKKNLFKNLIVATVFTLSTNVTFAMQGDFDCNDAVSQTAGLPFLSPGDVNTLLSGAGFDDVVENLSSLNGMQRLSEALAILKGQRDSLLAENRALRDFSAPASLAKNGVSLASAQAKAPCLFADAGLPLLTFSDIGGIFGNNTDGLPLLSLEAFEEDSAVKDQRLASAQAKAPGLLADEGMPLLTLGGIFGNNTDGVPLLSLEEFEEDSAVKDQRLASAQAKAPDLFGGEGMPLLTLDYGLSLFTGLETDPQTAVSAAFEPHSVAASVDK